MNLLDEYSEIISKPIHFRLQYDYRPTVYTVVQYADGSVGIIWRRGSNTYHSPMSYTMDEVRQHILDGVWIEVESPYG